MKRALEPIGRSLIFSGCCRVTPVGIEWKREPTAEELDADDYTIQRCEESVGWWEGDMIVMRHRREGADKTLSEFAAEYARVRGKNEVGARQKANVAQFFPVVERSTRPITWGHHYIIWAWLAGGGLKKCLGWLKRAGAGDKGVAWSTGRLRAELGAAARKGAEPAEPAPPVGEWDELGRIESWASTRMDAVRAIKADEAKAILGRMASTVAFIDALRLRATAGARAREGGR